MSRRLVYVIGPSGAGKDSVLQGLRGQWPAQSAVHWAQRTITRPADAGGEQHEPADAAGFERLRQAGAFAMHWRANGLDYGVRHAELLPLADGRWVMVNGSRGWLSELLARWPEATVVHIGASPEVLARRLAARGRETAQAVAERLARQVPVQLPPGAIDIRNDGALADAVAALAQALQARDPSLRSGH